MQIATDIWIIKKSVFLSKENIHSILMVSPDYMCMLAPLSETLFPKRYSYGNIIITISNYQSFAHRIVDGSNIKKIVLANPEWFVMCTARCMHCGYYGVNYIQREEFYLTLLKCGGL